MVPALILFALTYLLMLAPVGLVLARKLDVSPGPPWAVT